MKPQPDVETKRWIEVHDSLPGEWMPLYEDDDGGSRATIRCPYGSLGTLLWVRETWSVVAQEIGKWAMICYRADDKTEQRETPNPVRRPWGSANFRTRPSIFMPRWASRLTLEVVSVRVERLQEITEDEAVKEAALDWFNSQTEAEKGKTYTARDIGPRGAFIDLWDSLNGKRAPWASNPWVWRIEFRRVNS